MPSQNNAHSKKVLINWQYLKIENLLVRIVGVLISFNFSQRSPNVN